MVAGLVDPPELFVQLKAGRPLAAAWLTPVIAAAPAARVVAEMKPMKRGRNVAFMSFLQIWCGFEPLTYLDARRAADG
jgi:hypothetical protein